MTEDGKALLERYVHRVWEQGDLDAIDDFLADGYRRHLSPTKPPLDREQQKALLKSFRAAFP